MNFFSFILLVLFLGAVAFVANRRIRALQAEKAMQTAETTLQADKPSNPPELLAQRFRLWSEQAFAADPQLVAWLKTLGEPALVAFTDEVATFTQEARIDLNWLLDQDLRYHPTTHAQLTAMLSHYCQAWYCAVQAQQAASALQTWAKFNQNPDDPAHQPLLQALWAQVVSHRLTAPVNGEVLIAKPSDQQSYMLHSIRDIAQREPKRFYELLPEAIATAHLTPPPTFVDRVEQIAQRLVGVRAPNTSPDSAATLPKETKTVAA